MAQLIRGCVNEIPLANLKIESAIAAAETGRHQGPTLLLTLVRTRLIERYLKHGWVLVQVCRDKRSDLCLHQCPLQLDMSHRALEYHIASVGVPACQVLSSFDFRWRRHALAPECRWGHKCESNNGHEKRADTHRVLPFTTLSRGRAK